MENWIPNERGSNKKQQDLEGLERLYLGLISNSLLIFV